MIFNQSRNWGNCLSECILLYPVHYVFMSTSAALPSSVIMRRTSRRSLMVPGPFSGENTYFYQDLVTLAWLFILVSSLLQRRGSGKLTPHEGKLEKLRPQRRGFRYLPRSIATAVYWFNDVNCRYFVFIGGWWAAMGLVIRAQTTSVRLRSTRATPDRDLQDYAQSTLPLLIKSTSWLDQPAQK